MHEQDAGTDTRGIEHLNDLLECTLSDATPADKYARMRALLERAVEEVTREERVRFPNLFSRLEFACRERGLATGETKKIHRFRARANRVANGETRPTAERCRADARVLGAFIGRLFGVPLPGELAADEEEEEEQGVVHVERLEMKRIVVERWDDNYIHGFEEEKGPGSAPVRVRHHVAGVNAEFDETIDRLWQGCVVHLLDARAERETIVPGMIVLEPDYLLDISSLAACRGEQGTHYLHYFMNKIRAREKTAAILLGNMVNLFFDEMVATERDALPDLATLARQAFHLAPLDFLACGKAIDAAFFGKAAVHHENLLRVVHEDFREKRVRREAAVVEPSFVCGQLGLQGRLDFLQMPREGSPAVLIELKSGKEPFPYGDRGRVKPEHEGQAFLYQIVLQQVLGIPFNELDTYILYSACTEPGANLRYTRPYMRAIRELLNARNLIVAAEREIALDGEGEAARRLVEAITADNLVTRGRGQAFVERYIVPSIEAFRAVFT